MTYDIDKKLTNFSRNNIHNNFTKSLILTLAYTEQFSFPLNAGELYLRLITHGLDDWWLMDRGAQRKIFVNSLGDLVSYDVLGYADRMFYLNKVDSIKIRQKRQIYSQDKLKEAEDLVGIIKFLPFILGVVVTGSLAVKNAKKDDDIDFMIITKKNRLWLARIILVLFATIKGKRRSFAKEEKNSWCFNLWLEETDFVMPLERRSIYEAYEIVQAKWLLDRGNTKQKFFENNNWVKKYVPHLYLHQKNSKTFIESKDFGYFPVIDELVTVLNWIFYKFQILYMKPHITREKVAKTHAFFHPRDTKGQILENWKRTLRFIKWPKSKQVKSKNKKVTLVTGVFDILHDEHIKFLQKAKKIGSILVVAIESDTRVRQMKGEGRPINPCKVRIANIEKLSLADTVIVLPEKFSTPKDHQKFIESIKPDFLAVSSHTAHLDKKTKIMNMVGGKVVVVHKHNPKVSTTQIISKKVIK
jgi:rfaE bifunctional protein nucleotidyltransferase chain/domain